MTDYLQEHSKILILAVKKKLPEKIDELSDLSLDIVKELVDENYLSAKHVMGMGRRNFQYLEASITLAGREYLTSLEKQNWDNSIQGKIFNFIPKIFGWIFGILGAIIGALIIAWLIQQLFK